MEYVIPVVLVVLLVAAGLAYMVLNATRQPRPPAPKPEPRREPERPASEQLANRDEPVLRSD